MQTRKFRVLTGFAVIAIVGAVLTACSGTASAPPPTSKATAAGSSLTLKQIIAGAKKEGTLNLYISSDYQALVDGFQKAYPWAKLNVTNGGSTTLAQKWLTEAESGISQVDLGFIQPLAADQLQKLNALSDVRVPNDVLVPKALQGSKYTHSVNQQPIVIGYNTNLVKDPPKQLIDLASPKWKNKLIIDDPKLDSETAWVLASTRKAWGDKKWNKWITGIAANNPQLTTDAGDSYTTTLQGNKSICLCTYGDFQAQAKGTPMKAVFYTAPNGLLEYSIVAAIAAKAPDPYMAALMVNWTLSKAGGQTAFADNARLPAVPLKNAETSMPKGVTAVNVIPLITDYIDHPDSYNTAFAAIDK
jgi:iron(III) transport system substrate-binding protein